MRHVTGVALAVGLAAAVFFAASWGYLKLLPGRVTAPAGGSLIHDHAVVQGFAALLAVGLLAGILIAVPAISPLAAGLPGLALLAWTGLYLASTRRAVQYIPLKSHAYGAGFEDLLFGGLLAMAGLVMVIPLFVPSRWRRPAPAPVPYGAVDAYPDLVSTQTMAASPTLLDDWAVTAPQPRLESGPARPPWAPAEPGRTGQPPDYR
jgi:hypothetical protein